MCWNRSVPGLKGVERKGSDSESPFICLVCVQYVTYVYRAFIVQIEQTTVLLWSTNTVYCVSRPRVWYLIYLQEGKLFSLYDFVLSVGDNLLVRGLPMVRLRL